WRITGRYMKDKEEILQAYGTTWAGNGSDQLPTPTLFIHPGSNYLLSATGVLNSSTSLELSWGRAANSLNYQLQLQQLFRSKAGFYYQNSFKPQSIYASFNSQIDFVDNSSNPFDTGFGYANAATGVFNSYQQASKYALPEWRYHNFEWYAQDNWKPTGRVTLDYGVRFYYLSPQWDTTLQASNFLPDKFNPSAAALLYTPVCVGGAPGAGCIRRGMDPTLIAQGV